MLYYLYLCIFYSPLPSFHFFLILAVSLPLAPSAARGSAIHLFLVFLEVAALVHMSVLQRIRELFSGTLVSLTAELSG